MPMRNLIGLIVAIGVGIFAYSDVTQRLTQLETARQLMEADLLKRAEQTPVNQELYMLIEFLAEQFEVMEKEVQSIESNNINIDFLQTQVEKMQDDVEQLKDKVRQNGNY
jgi:septation ring formation regulator EzrA